ncbi:hypothetical protein [Nocardia goodfellowii]|uniref:Flp pilus assembly protein CpaB n=1 Tax=Nocardia goodfellowii TaxID=882446 RepID=A0ABS4QSY8_9NOCA|nr:hypothetical protein [Nocardia goodfellowii]MBP2193721.1 hypothetical protein [Nocardia goodfellowii]
MPETLPPAGTSALRRGVLSGVVAVGAAALMFALGTLHPPRPLGVGTDRLGPERGEAVSDYLARARVSLDGTDAQEHWALVSFTTELPPAAIPAHSGGIRIGQVLHRVPIPRVQTPIVTVGVPAGDAVAVASADNAAWQLQAQLDRDVTLGVLGDRGLRATSVSIARLRAGCACTVGLVVRGTLTELRNLATGNDIRAVEALPADAVDGHFAVTPLLPAHTGTVGPAPDDGPVPER